MTVRSRDSGQPARVMLRRNKVGAADRKQITGNPVTTPEPTGAPPLFVRLESAVKRLEARCDELAKRLARIEGGGHGSR
jgi:hypothetical protein